MKPVHVVGRPVEFGETESFAVNLDLRFKPLEVSLCFHHVTVKDKVTGEPRERFVLVCARQQIVKIGLLELEIQEIAAEAPTKDEAQARLSELLGQIIQGVYMDLMLMDDKLDVAASMLEPGLSRVQ